MACFDVVRVDLSELVIISLASAAVTSSNLDQGNAILDVELRRASASVAASTGRHPRRCFHLRELRCGRSKSLSSGDSDARSLSHDGSIGPLSASA